MLKSHWNVKRLSALFALSLVLGLTACGGGGGGGSSSSSSGAATTTDPANYTLPSSVSAIPPKN
jgi:ABC-type glycerol-3-phosphate transport system substrate-binding protein